MWVVVNSPEQLLSALTWPVLRATNLFNTHASKRRQFLFVIHLFACGYICSVSDSLVDHWVLSAAFVWKITWASRTQFFFLCSLYFFVSSFLVLRKFASACGRSLLGGFSFTALSMSIFNTMCSALTISLLTAISSSPYIPVHQISHILKNRVWVQTIVFAIHTLGDFVLLVLAKFWFCTASHCFGHSPPLNARCPFLVCFVTMSANSSSQSLSRVWSLT